MFHPLLGNQHILKISNLLAYCHFRLGFPKFFEIKTYSLANIKNTKFLDFYNNKCSRIRDF